MVKVFSPPEKRTCLLKLPFELGSHFLGTSVPFFGGTVILSSNSKKKNLTFSEVSTHPTHLEGCVPQKMALA